MKLLALALAVCGTLPAADYFAYTGTYTRGASKGIYLFRFQSSSGKFSPAGIAAETPNPAFLAVHPNRRVLYAVHEGGSAGSSVTAFTIDPKTGKLAELNTVPSGGDGPCHLTLDHTGRYLAVANYGSGTIAVFRLSSDGKIDAAPIFSERHEGSSVNRERQQSAHAHDAVFSPDNRFLLLADLGLDKIFVYRFDAAKGVVAPADPAFAQVAAGAGVRHMVFHPNGRILYAIGELNSTITVFGFDPASGALTHMQTISTLPADFTGTSTTAEIAINAAGTRVYGSNRGHDSIALFAVDPERFTLTAMERTPTLGKSPRHFTLDPTGAYLFAENANSDNIAIFRVHPATGELTPQKPATVETPMPICLVFVPVE
jgi:6-phosphogluconolactonase